jgi:hypothetical protein
MTTTQPVPGRPFADVFDLRVEGPSERHGVSLGSEYIGGYGGIGWYEYFRDAITGEIYRVHCSDGVDGGKDAHSDQDGAWLGKCYSAIVKRCHLEASLGHSEIYISRNERTIMQDMTHSVWLESSPKKNDGEQSRDGLEGGLVGHCHGIPVICDLAREDDLPPRMEESAIRAGQMFAEQQHPELQDGEVFAGNRDLLDSCLSRWRTERYGDAACDRNKQEEVVTHWPIFIQRSELDYEVAALKRMTAREATQN